MKFTISWLKEHLETNASTDEIVLALTDLGLEVERTQNPLENLSEFTVGQIMEVVQHPNADRLKVCKVNTGKGEKQIICGAPNARRGIKVVVAHPGDYIPGLGKKIKVGNIRGVESYGMMCSERELMLSDEHEGIIELSRDAEVGCKYTDQANNLEISIDIAITPNRPDALAIHGVARDLAARGIGKLRHIEAKKIAGKFESPIKVSLDKSVIADACPIFIGRYFRNVKNVQSPKWLQAKLVSIGLRPISALVDITNFVTYDLGRPLHVFDADKLAGDLLIRQAKDNEKIIALDGLVYDLQRSDTVITCDGKVESIAGIIGGMNSGCSLETKNVFLESAFFSSSSVAKTGRRLKINSDARYRFERGVDPNFTEPGIEIATRLVLDICGGEASEIVKEGTVPKPKEEIIFRPKRVKSLIGISVPINRQKEILTQLGFVTKKRDKDSYLVNVPSWRPDISGEADLIEEIVRVTSLSKLNGSPMVGLAAGAKAPILTPAQKRLAVLRRRIATFGLNECISYSFIDERSAEFFAAEKDVVKLLNPISSEMSHMRPSLLPGLCSAVKRNQARSFKNLKLFEIGETFYGRRPGQQRVNAAGLLVGDYLERSAFKSERSVDVFDGKRIVLGALDDVGVATKKLILQRDNLPLYMHPGRSGILSIGHKNAVAIFGELHPRLVDFYDLKGPVVAFEILVDNIPLARKKQLARAPIKMPEFQPVERDFSFVVPTNFEVDSIKKAVEFADRNLISEVRVFDIFEGEEAENQLGPNKKSVAFMVRLQPEQATLTDSEIEAVGGKIIKSVFELTGGALRS